MRAVTRSGGGTARLDGGVTGARWACLWPSDTWEMWAPSPSGAPGMRRKRVGAVGRRAGGLRCGQAMWLIKGAPESCCLRRQGAGVLRRDRRPRSLCGLCTWLGPFPGQRLGFWREQVGPPSGSREASLPAPGITYEMTRCPLGCEAPSASPSGSPSLWPRVPLSSAPGSSLKLSCPGGGALNQELCVPSLSLPFPPLPAAWGPQAQLQDAALGNAPFNASWPLRHLGSQRHAWGKVLFAELPRSQH